MNDHQDVRTLARRVLLPGFVGTTAPDWVRREVADGLAGVVLFGRNVVHDEQVAALTTTLRAERDDVVVAIDEEGGDVTRLDVSTGSVLPGNLALGVVGDAGLTRRVAAGLGRRLATCGVTLDLAPCADLTLTLDDPIIGVRAFGADPDAVAEQVAAFVDGLQGAGVAACAKHFPGHGAATADSHLALPVLPRTEHQLRDGELRPFRAAVQAGVRAVMTGHLVVPGWGTDPATLNRRAVEDVLRGELGFTGAVITDALEMGAVAGRLGDRAGLAEAAVRALLAGADLLCLGGELADESVVHAVVEALVAAVRSGRLPEQRLVEAADRARGLGTRPGARNDSPPDDLPALGLAAARRALRVHGEPRLPSPPLVVDVVVPPSIAVGAVPWGLGPHLAELLPDTRVLRVEPDVPPDRITAAAEGRPVVLVTRDAHRHPEVLDLTRALTRTDTVLVHVETGVPGPTTSGVTARIDTHGGSYASLRAAAELLAAHHTTPRDRRTSR